MSQNTNHTTVFLHFLQLSLNVLFPRIGFIHLGILGESLLLGLAPILVEPPLDLLTKMLGPNSIKRAESTRCFDITNNPNNNHWGTFNNRHSFASFLFVKLCMKGTSSDTCTCQNTLCFKRKTDSCTSYFISFK